MLNGGINVHTMDHTHHCHPLLPLLRFSCDMTLFKSSLLQLRESLVQSLVSMDIQTVGSLQQSTAALDQLTRVSDELSDTAQTTAAQAVRHMSGLLRQQSALGASTQDIQQTGQ